MLTGERKFFFSGCILYTCYSFKGGRGPGFHGTLVGRNFFWNFSGGEQIGGEGFNVLRWFLGGTCLDWSIFY